MRLTAFFGILLMSLFMVAQPGDGPLNQMVDGEKHGRWVLLFEGSKKVRTDAEFHHGRPIKVTHFHTNGQQRAVMVFDEEGKTCLVTEWHSNGKTATEGTYVSRGVKGGIWRTYDKNGLLIAQESYVEGVQQGAQFYFYPGGKHVLEQGKMVDGKKHGTWVRYLEDGTKSKVENFDQGKYHGEWKMYDVNGRLSVLGHFQNDLRHGKWLFYEEGKVTLVEHYRLGKQIKEKES